MLKDVSREDYVARLHKQAKGMSGQIDEEFTFEGLHFRWNLIKEEFDELAAEMLSAKWQVKDNGFVKPETVTNMLKELCDLQVVLSGAAVQFKQLRNFPQAFVRVCESNMSKRDLNTGEFEYREGDGKILKGKNYIAPNLKGLI